MKQTYKKPEMRVVSIRTNHFIALSMDPNQKAGSSTTVLSRRRQRDEWEDEEEY
ncbi:MAG: hypothetical protein IKH32_03480 [Prevotella sp.]|nr:hypothetical protein [Prevotella sp.]